MNRKWIVLALLLFSVFEVGIAQNATEEPPALIRGRQALKAKRYDEALKEFKSALKVKSGKCSECYCGMAIAYSNKGESKKALEKCNEAVKSGANQDEIGDAHYLKGRLLLSGYQEQKELKEAESEFRATLLAAPDKAEAHLNLGICLLKMTQDEAGLKEVRDYLLAVPNGPNSTWARRVLENPRRAREQSAPDFQLTLLTGEKVSLAQLSGKTVVFDFWATWCSPCRASLGEIKEMAKQYSGQNFVLISASADKDEGALRKYIEKNGMTWQQYWDSDHGLAKLFNVKAYPTYILIDGEGFIRSNIVGMDPKKSVVDRLKRELKAALKDNKD